jgi:hypothetical protein
MFFEICHKIITLAPSGRHREARECFQRCIDITPAMAREVIEACRQRNIGKSERTELEAGY